MSQKTIPKDALRGQWLYDFLMKGIEPDLVTENLETIDAKYPHESAIDHDARMERYDRAFDEFDRVIDLIADQLVKEAVDQRHEVQSTLKEKEKTEREHDVTEAEHLFDDTK